MKPAERPPLAGGAFKLSGSFKPAGAPKDSRYQYDVVPAALLQPTQQQQQQQQKPTSSGPGSSRAASEDAEMPLPPPPPPAGSTPAAEAAGKATTDGASSARRAAEALPDDDDGDLDIPDEKMIQWAKAKRERLRSAHLAPDYIPTASMPGLSR